MFRWGRRGGVRKVAERANVPMRAPRDVRFRKRRRFRYGEFRRGGTGQGSDSGTEGRAISEASPPPLRRISRERNVPAFRCGRRGTFDSEASPLPLRGVSRERNGPRFLAAGTHHSTGTHCTASTTTKPSLPSLLRVTVALAPEGNSKTPSSWKSSCEGIFF